MTDICTCYDAENERCRGTKECDLCSCGGLESQCTFYPPKRPAKKVKISPLYATNKLQNNDIIEKEEQTMASKKNLRRISTTVTAQTEHNLHKLAAESGYKNIGRVIDKLVREKMISTRIVIEEDEDIKEYSGIMGYDPFRFFPRKKMSFEAGTFAWALAALKDGRRIQRAAWQDAEYIETVFEYGGLRIYMVTPHGATLGTLWTPSSEDIFATDWEEK